MRRRTWAERTLGALLLALASPSAVSHAAEPDLAATLSCRPEAAPGRVLCELGLVVRGGAELTWVDALVTASPDFARPLRSRVAAERFAGAAGAERKLSLAFLATGSGVGQVSVSARAVVCRGAGERRTCRPEIHRLAAELRVGS